MSKKEKNQQESNKTKTEQGCWRCLLGGRCIGGGQCAAAETARKMQISVFGETAINAIGATPRLVGAS